MEVVDNAGIGVTEVILPNFHIKLVSLSTIELSMITSQVSTHVFQSAMTVEQRR